MADIGSKTRGSESNTVTVLQEDGTTQQVTRPILNACKLLIIRENHVGNYG